MYLRGGNWITEFYHEGVRYKKALGVGISKTVAKEREASFKQEVREGKHLQKARRIKFEKFCEKYLENAKVDKRPKSAKRNKVSINMLKPFFEGQLISSIHPFQVEQYKKSRLEAGANPATINRDVATLRNMMNKAVDWKYLQVNPLVRVKMLEESTGRMWILSPDDEVNLLAECEKSEQWGGPGRRYLRDLVAFALYSGMRLDEILSLLKVNVHLEQNYLLVVNSKSHRSRSVPVSETLREILERRLEMPGEYVFTNTKGERFKELTGACVHAIERAGLVRVENGKRIRFRFHDLRHSFGSRLGMAGVDLKTIMEIMGHSTAKMSMRYQHPTTDHKLEAVRNLDKIGKIFTPKVTPLKKTDRKKVVVSGG